MLTDALVLELTKTRRSRPVRAVAVAAVLLAAAAAAMYSLIARTVVPGAGAVEAAELFSFTVTKASFAPVAAGAVGALLAGSEYRSRLLALTLLRVPDRRVVLTTKYASVLLVAALLLVVGLAGSLVVSHLVTGGLRTSPTAPGAYVLAVLGHAYATAGWALAGCSLGVLLRSPLGALGALLGTAYVVEPAARALLSLIGSEWAEAVAEHLPFGAVAALEVQRGGAPPLLLAGTAPGAGPLSAAVVFLVFVAALVALAYAAFERCDVAA